MPQKGCSTFALKMIAVITMLTDHIGAIFYPQYLILRVIGRLAFPIYCFLLAEGFFHTGNRKKYGQRLFLFALLSEIPYDLAFHQTFFYLGAQNVFLTLFIGLVLMDTLSHLSTRKGYVLSGAAAVMIAAFAAWFIGSDYGAQGILLITVFYLMRGRQKARNVSYTAVTVCFNLSNQLQWFSVAALLPICLYNGKKGPSCKYFFYAFYPVHLLILHGIWVIWRTRYGI
jgi:hypothetical protein